MFLTDFNLMTFHGALLVAYLTSAIADQTTTIQALHRGAVEGAFLKLPIPAQITAEAAMTAGQMYLLETLWRRKGKGPKALAIAIYTGTTAAHTWAALHNTRVCQPTCH